MTERVPQKMTKKEKEERLNVLIEQRALIEKKLILVEQKNNLLNEIFDIKTAKCNIVGDKPAYMIDPNFIKKSVEYEKLIFRINLEDENIKITQEKMILSQLSDSIKNLKKELKLKD